MVLTWPSAPESGLEESVISLVSMPEVASGRCVGRWLLLLVTMPLLLLLPIVVGVLLGWTVVVVVELELEELDIAVVGRW